MSIVLVAVFIASVALAIWVDVRVGTRRPGLGYRLLGLLLGSLVLGRLAQYVLPAVRTHGGRSSVAIVGCFMYWYLLLVAFWGLHALADLIGKGGGGLGVSGRE
jgi:hypothetical protein